MLLQLDDILAGYGKRPVLNGISLCLNEGEKVTLIGHNGAGKSTTLKVILGILKPQIGRVIYKGVDISRRAASDNVKDGITLVPQGRAVFGDLRVKDNLKLAGLTIARRKVFEERLETVYALFPIIKEREKQLAGTLSGGEQRMLSVGIGLMQGPKLLLLDEPSLGLAPVLVDSLMQTFDHINKREVSILLVEQSAKAALQFAQRAYVIRNGQIILEDEAPRIAATQNLWDLF